MSETGATESLPDNFTFPDALPVPEAEQPLDGTYIIEAKRKLPLPLGVKIIQVILAITQIVLWGLLSFVLYWFPVLLVSLLKL